MPSPEATHHRQTVALRKMEFAAKEAGTDEEMERFRAHVDQPVPFGDPVVKQMLMLEAAADFLLSALGLEVKEEELSEDAQIYEYRESDGKMHRSEQDLSGSEGPQNPEGQLLDDDPKPSDEADAPSDEDVEASAPDSAINMRERGEEQQKADDEARDPLEDTPMAEEEFEDEDESSEEEDNS